MKIMVFDVPAETGGALSILNDFYEEVVHSRDNKIKWIFVISTPELQETENIKILRFPWIKKSWGHRLFFDYIVAPRLIKKYGVDKILSLQNVAIPNINIPQIVYVHQSLPFILYKFRFKDDKLLWVYQNIISKNIIKSIKRADRVIVQTNWMKKACAELANIQDEKIDVVPPRVKANIKNFFQANHSSLSTFFYPASGIRYKNHKVIVDACKILQQKGIKNYKVIFTLKGNENKYVEGLYSEIENKKLPIEFAGKLSRDQVYDLYTRSILIFPSFVETFGLPLLEAKLHRGIIFASDCPFSHEILDGYENAYFFNPLDSRSLGRIMREVLDGKIKYCFNNFVFSGKFKSRKAMLDLIVLSSN